MISKKEQFKNLVKAGGLIIQHLKLINACFETAEENECEVPEEIGDIWWKVDDMPFRLIVESVAGVVDSEYCAPDVVRILFADAASLFADRNRLADEYLELVCSIVFTGNGWEKLDKLERQVHKSVLHYIRNNY